MKNFKSVFFLFMLLVAGTAVSAQNGQSVFSEVKIYDNLDGSGTVEAKLTPNGAGIGIVSMTLVGDRAYGSTTLNVNTRVNPFVMVTNSGPGNSGGTTLAVNFLMAPEGTNGSNHIQGLVTFTRRVGDHLVQDSFAFEREVRRR